MKYSVNTYTELQAKLEVIKMKKSKLNYSIGITLLQGLVIEQANFEQCILLSLKLEQYFQRWKDVRNTEPMLEKHRVDNLLVKVASRIVYLNLIEECKKLEHALSMIKGVHHNKKVLVALTKQMKQDEETLNQILETL